MFNSEIFYLDNNLSILSKSVQNTENGQVGQVGQVLQKKKNNALVCGSHATKLITMCKVSRCLANRINRLPRPECVHTLHRLHIGTRALPFGAGVGQAVGQLQREPIEVAQLTANNSQGGETCQR